MSLPDRPRATLSPPARALAASAVDLTRRLAWRTLHPADRDRFVEAPAPAAASRLPYDAADGGRGHLLRVPKAASGSGEPVVVAHALGLAPDAYRYGEHPLVDALSRVGFEVFLLAHRGDRDVEVVNGARMDFDAILEKDVPGALEAVRAASGFERVHWVGHGLGGQLGLVAAARGEALASVVAMSAPVRFRRPRTEVRHLSLLTRLLPEGRTLPADWLARAALPALGQSEWMGDAPGQRVRGLVEHASYGVPFGLVDQVSAWIREGRLTSRAGLVDYVSTLSQARCPLFVGFAQGSSVAGAWATEPAVEAWGHDDALSFGVAGRSSALLFGREPAFVQELVDWLEDRRRLAWSSSFRSSLSA